MKRVVTVVGVVGLLAGCASSPAQSPWLMSRGAAIPMSCAPLSQDQELALNLAQKTADEGRLHAALANLERLPGGLPQANLYKARILRSLNRPEAQALYTSLLGTCLKAQGEHGLGQLASAQGRYQEALEHLRLAANLDPTSDTIRNDLGVVYMNLGRMDEARFELLTALELNETEKQPALNLLTLLIFQGNLPQASALAQRMGFSASEFRTAEQRAQTLRSQIGVAGAAAAKPGTPTPASGAQQRSPAAETPAPKPAETRPAPAQQAVAPVVAAPVAKPADKPVAPQPVAQPAVARTAESPARPAPAVPAPQLSNFRPAPVVPLSVASAARPPAAPAPAVAPVVVAAAPAPAVTRTAVASVAPSRQVAAAPVAVNQPAAPAVAAPAPAAAPATVAQAPAASVAPTPAATPRIAAPAVVQPAAPAVAAAPAVPAPVASVASAAPASRSIVSAPGSTPAATPASQARAKIEMRPGRLIVPDDGGFIRVEPVGDLQGNTVANQR